MVWGGSWQTGTATVATITGNRDGSYTIQYTNNQEYNEAIELQFLEITCELATYGVVYNPGSGTNAPIDSQSYDVVSNSTAVVASGSPKPPAGKQFSGWTIEGDDSGTVYYAGDAINLTDPEINALIFENAGSGKDGVLQFNARYVDTLQSGDPIEVPVYYQVQKTDGSYETVKTSYIGGKVDGTSYLRTYDSTYEHDGINYLYSSDDSKLNAVGGAEGEEGAIYVRYNLPAVTLHYASVDEDMGTVDPKSENVTVKNDTATGSTATAKPGYEFVGWYDNEECAGDPVSTDETFAPSKPEGGWVEATYYAKWKPVPLPIYIEVYKNGTLVNASEHAEASNLKNHTAGFDATPEGDRIKVTYTYESLNCADIALLVKNFQGYSVSVESDNTSDTPSIIPGEDSVKCSITGSGANWELDDIPSGATIKVNLTPKTDASYTVHYVLDGTETKLADDKVVEGVEFDKQFTETAATIDGYRLADDETSPKTVTAGYENNEITFRYVADEAQTVTVSYQAVNGTVDPEENTIREADASGLTAVDATADTGHQFDAWYKGSVAEENKLDLAEDPEAADIQGVLNRNGELYAATTLVANYVKDESQTQNAEYTVRHVVGGEVKATEEFTSTAWVNDDPAMISVQQGSLDQNEYTGYKWEKTVISGTETAAAEGQSVESGTVIDVIYVANFSDFAVEGDEWVYDNSDRTIEVSGIYASDKLTYMVDGEVIAEATVEDDGSISGEPVFSDVSDTAEVTVMVTRGGKTAVDAAAMTITPRPVDVTIPAQSKTYDGTDAVIAEEPLHLTFGAATGADDGYVSGTDFVATIDAANVKYAMADVHQNEPLKADADNVKLAGEDAGNYYVRNISGTGSISEAGIEGFTLSGTGYTGVYDGEAHDAVLSADVAGDFVDGTEWEITYSLDENGEFTAEMPQVTDVDDTDVIYIKAYNANYGEMTIDVNATVTPATLTVTTNSATKTYDGTPLTATGSIRGLVNGETVDFVVTGSRTAVGSSTNTYNLHWNNGTAKADNYTIVEHLGTLTVTPAPVTPDPTPDNPPTPPIPGGPDTPTPGPDTPGTTPGGTTPGTGDDATDDNATDEGEEEATEETIDDDATPMASGLNESPIADDATPLASGTDTDADQHENCWVHWVMIVGIVLSVIYFAGVGIRRSRYTSDLHSYENQVLSVEDEQNPNQNAAA